ncbi:MAG: prepilin-type N-terminal cleavage/methylation domain-containing protein [Candidatus Omnitrophica bacterium]|nr:prepilin-type N-terminal cleavage/methylation domain-containing protein [Candidatus Omnitrophota bacterium]
MKTSYKSSGFTLLELLVVIIIVGVLAGVALPRLFQRIEGARAAEALESLGTTKRFIEACAMAYNNNFTNCSSFATIGVTDPSYGGTTNAAAHFGYAISVAANSFEIVATRNSLDNGNTSDTISLRRSATGAIARVGTTAFSGVQ